MRPTETIATLAGYQARGAGTDAERRAANRLVSELARDRVRGDREARLESFWSRPNWALAHCWHVALGLAGSLLSESEPRIGAALVAAALVSLIADATSGFSLGRRLTPERASQNVVSDAGGASTDSAPVRLIITANYDSGRTGLVYRDGFRRAAARLGRYTGGISPGWLGWLAIAFVWLLVIAALRLNGHKSTGIGIAQLIPTVGLVLALALLLELASSNFGPAANDNASGVAAAIGLLRALDAAPPRRLAVDLVLQGAGDGEAIGLSRYLRAHRKDRRAPNTIVLGIAASGAGNPCWWYSDGPLLPVGYFKELRKLCAEIATDEPHFAARAHRGRGTTPALPARLRRLPAISIGGLNDLGLAQGSHQLGDTPDATDAEVVDQVVEFGLLLVDAIDGFIASRAGRGVPAPTPA